MVIPKGRRALGHTEDYADEESLCPRIDSVGILEGCTALLGDNGTGP